MLKLIKSEIVKKNLISEKGAMETVVVGIFLVIIGVGALMGLTGWIVTEKSDLEKSTSTKITSVVDEITESP